MANSKLSADLLILKAVLLLRRAGNTYLTKAEQIADVRRWLSEDYFTEEDFFGWMEALKEDIAKTPEQREAEMLAFREELAQREAEQFYIECRSLRRDRDEWDDLWDDRARSCGATPW